MVVIWSLDLHSNNPFDWWNEHTCLLSHLTETVLKDKKRTGDHINLQELRAENRLGPTLFYNIRNQTYTSPSLLSLPPSSQEIGGNFSGELPKRQLVVHTPNPSPYGEDYQNQEAPPTCIEFSSVSKCLKIKYPSILKHLVRSYYVQGTILKALGIYQWIKQSLSLSRILHSKREIDNKQMQNTEEK